MALGIVSELVSDKIAEEFQSLIRPTRKDSTGCTERSRSFQCSVKSSEPSSGKLCRARGLTHAILALTLN